MGSLRVARYLAAIFTPLAVFLIREGLFGWPERHRLTIRAAWWSVTASALMPAACVLVLSLVELYRSRKQSNQNLTSGSL